MPRLDYKTLEHEKIDELYKSGKSLAILSKEFSHAPGTIKKFLKTKGIELREIGVYNYDILSSIEYYKNGKTLKEISKIFKVPIKVIKKNLINNGIKIIRKNTMYELNGKIFEHIDTEEKAYWLGFIFADGNISKSRPTFAINLQYSDIGHLEKLRKFLNYKQEIRKQTQKDGNSICRMKVDNKDLWNSLNNYGCIPTKSLIVEFPNLDIFIETNTYNKETLIKHFIRGFVDGNGSLTYCGGKKSRKYKLYPELNIVGTKKFLEELIKHLPINKDSKAKIYKHVNVANILLTNKQAYNCIKYLYEDATIYLDRKYNKYLEFRRVYEKP